ncbi:ABC transporter ATP-binding protein [Bacillus altitudinis]
MIIEIKDADIGYQEDQVISSLSFQFEKGKIHSIIGPNGCGKSTCLKAIGHQLKVLNGEVIFQQVEVSRWGRKAFAKELAFFMQENESQLEMTVRKLIEYGRFPHKKAFERFNLKDQAVIDQALHLTNLESLSDRAVNTLSGGERQRAWAAMAIAQQPSVLLLDEPTAYLDIHHQLEMIDLIQRLNKEQCLTIILVLHDIQQAAMISDQMIVLHDGRIYNSGAPKHVITNQMLRDVFKVKADIQTSHENDLVSISNFQLVERVSKSQ